MKSFISILIVMFITMLLMFLSAQSFSTVAIADSFDSLPTPSPTSYITPSPSPSPTPYMMNHMIQIRAEPELPKDEQGRWLIDGTAIDEVEISIYGGFMGISISLKDQNGKSFYVVLDEHKLEGLSELEDGEYTLSVRDSMTPEIAPKTVAFVIDRSLSLAEETEDFLSLPPSLVGQEYVSRDEYSGISLQLDADGCFEISHWRGEKREGYNFNLYHAQFFGRIDYALMLDDDMVLEICISKIDKAGARIYDVYYPPNEDVDEFVEYFPWELGTPIRIVPPLESDALCLIGVPNANGEYIYKEFMPHR